MTLTLVNPESYEIRACDEDRHEWLRQRREGIGASESPALLGLVRWASPTSVACDKLSDDPPTERDEFFLRWGRAVEGPLSRELAERTGRTVELFGRLVRSKRWPILQATPDAFEWDPIRAEVGVVEIKTSSRGEDWRDGPPPAVYCQLQHQLAVTGLQWGTAVALLHGRQFEWVDIERDDAFIADVLLPACEDFWARIQDGRPVPTDSLAVTKQALQRIYPEETAETLTLGGEWIELDEERQAVAAEIRRLEARKAEIDNALRAEIGHAGAAALPNGVTYSLKTTKRKGYTVEPTSFRALRRKEPK